MTSLIIYEKGKFGRQHAMAPLAVTINPFISLLYAMFDN